MSMPTEFEESQPAKPSNLAKYVGLGAAGISAPLIYKYLRTVRLSSDPVLKGIQKASGGRYSRTLHTAAPESTFGKLKDKLLFDADELHYLGAKGKDYLKDAPVRPKKFNGATFLNDPGDTAYVKGKANVGGATPDQRRLLDSMENDKWKEYKYFNEHAPNALPPTDNLGELLKAQKAPRDMKARQEYLKQVQTLLKSKYPDGYILKPTGGVQSAGVLPTDKHDFAELYKQYRSQRLSKRISQLDSLNGDAWEHSWKNLRSEPGFEGRVLHQMMRDPSKVIVQKRMPLETKGPIGTFISNMVGANPSKELRVHVVNGRAVPELTTSRYFHPEMALFERQKLKDATNFAQSISDRLPKEHQGFNFAMDVAPLQNGGFTMIESNPGGASGLLHPGSTVANPWKLRKVLTGQYGQTASTVGAGLGATAIGGAAALGTKAIEANNTPQPYAPLIV